MRQNFTNSAILFLICLRLMCGKCAGKLNLMISAVRVRRNVRQARKSDANFFNYVDFCVGKLLKYYFMNYV